MAHLPYEEPRRIGRKVGDELAPSAGADEGIEPVADRSHSRHIGGTASLGPSTVGEQLITDLRMRADDRQFLGAEAEAMEDLDSRAGLVCGAGLLNPMAKTIFERIVAREIPARIVHEDALCLAIHDIQPQAPVHVILFPKRPIPRIAEAAPEDQLLLGHLLLMAATIAKQLELAQGFRLVINNGPDGGESVPHLHIHLLGKRALAWPPG